jgi:hypothetical protein
MTELLELAIAQLKTLPSIEQDAIASIILTEIESEAATQELLAIPGLLERVNQNKLTPRHEYISWRQQLNTAQKIGV